MTQSVDHLVEKFKQKQEEAHDPAVLSKYISEKSDRKKYNFAGGLERDVIATRTALSILCLAREKRAQSIHTQQPYCTFGELFDKADEDGGIANLIRVLQNLKRQKEIYFLPEMLYQHQHTHEPIYLLPAFDNGNYHVHCENVFRSTIDQKDVPLEKRLGKSHIMENLETEGKKRCHKCGEEVLGGLERVVFRGEVYHGRCLKCAHCGSGMREGTGGEGGLHVTFDGGPCCSVHCLQMYDA
eukprot:CAMPEP_0201520860 /NCGR_PEP_ID=MMETSP0161_2-20130828/12955_1 /ASSEMBLY_ACC=CAM_ASM_000251 /TAXON_ID=180227 /ORGANISM="Neoparamoeba aestuarina, Strain SoJaBio B1-5/56/2" /LENGTH=240 /DNA_ID=CAMNT_0047919369 /DNA_START=25 /DNA_END=743 /DNA_ORIENTATION=+